VGIILSIITIAIPTTTTIIIIIPSSSSPPSPLPPPAPSSSSSSPSSPSSPRRSPPYVRGFTLDLDQGVLTLVWSEPVVVSQLDPTGITLVGDDTQYT
jgi:hypothetical protein